MDKYKVIKQLEIDISREDFESIDKNHPHITEKLIVDAINGVKVVANDLNETARTKEKGVGRIWDSVSGSAKTRQNLINENLIEGLSAVTIWLGDHDRHIGRIDKRIKVIAEKLYNTQDEIFKFYEEHKELKMDVEKLKECLSAFKKESDDRFNVLEHRLTKVEAHQHIDREIEKINTLRMATEIEIFTILDNLASGEAGYYYAKEQNEKNKVELLGYIKNKIKGKINRNQHNQFIDYRQLNQEINKLPPSEQKAISFIGSQYSSFANNNPLYEISDMIKIIATSKPEELESNINIHPNIRTFMTLESYIDEATKELLNL
ncbi:MAG: hypothetical protein KU38_03530 [Sulfurovum sp. FS08-3]|nr:MAG: hypothetical protein KU38_03530 [Sulfurovum sp. FS08-3]